MLFEVTCIGCLFIGSIAILKISNCMKIRSNNRYFIDNNLYKPPSYYENLDQYFEDPPPYSIN